MKRILILAALVAFALPVGAEAATWAIDTSHSQVGFKVRHFFSKVPGEFTAFQGTIEFDPEKPEAMAVQVTIDASSVNTNNEKRDGHLRSDDFFAAEANPEITFKSTKATAKDGNIMLEGLLTMRGVEKPVTLQVEFLGAGPDPWGGQRAGFTATGTINRTDFGVSWNKTLDNGSMLSDEVELTIEIEAAVAPPEKN